MSWSGVDRWTRADERAWLCTLAPTTLARYLGSLRLRIVDFHGHPITEDFLEECRYDHARAAARQMGPPAGIDGFGRGDDDRLTAALNGPNAGGTDAESGARGPGTPGQSGQSRPDSP
jgi:hypothetical protein